MNVRFETETRARLRRGLMKKGMELATLLADVLAGKDAERRIQALGLDDRPGERPAEKLRRYLDLVEGRRQLLDADSDAFGRCDLCGVALDVVALCEMPWADRCRVHASP